MTFIRVLISLRSDFKWYRPQAVSISISDDVYVVDLNRLIRIPVNQIKEQADIVAVITGSKGKTTRQMCNNFSSIALNLRCRGS
jgi:hypothetical protein